MRRLIPTVALLLLLAANVHGETIRFDPPNPTAHHSVDAVVSGVWFDGCLPSVKRVAIDGSTIVLHLNADVPPDIGCPQSLTQYRRTFHLDVLPPGSYTVILASDKGDAVTELARTPLLVRDADTLNITPYAVPTAGGAIAIDNPFYPATATVTIAGVATPVSPADVVHLVVNAPAHAVGAVDVTVSSAAGDVTAKAALLYYDPAAADPAVFETILFPLAFQGAGAFGSQWTTENFMLAGSSPAFFRDPLPCAGCSTKLTANVQLTNSGNPWGQVLYVLRGTTATVDFASRIREASRQSQSAGTEVPVVRERDFRGQLRFSSIPVDARFRTTLRLWSLGDFPQFIVQVEPGTNIVAPLSVLPIPGTAMYFASTDLSALLPQAKTTPVNVTIYPSGYPSSLTPVLFPQIWGMLSITNNDTQQVTIISPQ